MDDDQRPIGEVTVAVIRPKERIRSQVLERREYDGKVEDLRGQKVDEIQTERFDGG